jgi:hypothetical protein
MNTRVPNPSCELTGVFDEIRSEAIRNGGLDPATLRFRIVEYQKADGEIVAIHGDDLAFVAAVAAAVKLVQGQRDSEFCLQPVGFVQ